jgi:hypothetical protein
MVAYHAGLQLPVKALSELFKKVQRQVVRIARTLEELTADLEMILLTE